MAKKERSAFSRKVDEICRVVFLTEEGKPKSTLLVYSFSLALLFIAVYMISYVFLVDAIERMLASSSVLVRNIFEYLVPGVLVSIPCVSLSYLCKKRMNMIAAAYSWLDLIVILAFVGMTFTADKSDWLTDYSLFLMIVGIPMLISAISGTIGSQIIYRKRAAALERKKAQYSAKSRLGY